MTKKQMVEAILKTYDKEMAKEYGPWIARQSKATVEKLYNIRVNKEEA